MKRKNFKETNEKCTNSTETKLRQKPRCTRKGSTNSNALERILCQKQKALLFHLAFTETQLRTVSLPPKNLTRARIAHCVIFLLRAVGGRKLDVRFFVARRLSQINGISDDLPMLSSRRAEPRSETLAVNDVAHTTISRLEGNCLSTPTGVSDATNLPSECVQQRRGAQQLEKVCWHRRNKR